jgi:putative ABC transport system ATP-binding protein
MNKHSKYSPFERLSAHIKSEKDDLLILTYLTLGYSLLSIATPVAVQALVNNVTMGGVIQPLIVISVILFGLLVLSGLLFVLETYVVELIQRRLFVGTAMHVAHKTQGAVISIYDKTNPVELVNRFFDITTIQKSAAVLLTVGFIASIQVVIGSIILIFYSFYFAIIIVMVLMFFWFILRILGKEATQTAIKESEAKYATAAWLESIAGNFYLFKFYNGLHRAESFTNTLANQYLAKRSAHFSHLLRQIFSAVMFYAFIGAVMLATGGILVVNGHINLGQFVAAELIFFGVLGAFVRLVSKLGDYYDILAALDKIGMLDDLPQEEIKTNQTALERLDALTANTISFAYSDRIHPIQNVNFELKKGGSLAIVGISGSGKSTIVDLITGLRMPTKGQIEYNGVDLRQVNREVLRNKIGIATEVEIIEGSILENIQLNNTDISMHEINAVLAAFNLVEDFAKLEHGLDTVLTGFGAPLSTTQLQRLMLVRAIVTNPELLIIDGIIDNLSTEQTSTVIHYLNQRKNDWMLLLTTRSKELASHFDQQLVLSDLMGRTK